jgi:hypothetical protein
VTLFWPDSPEAVATGVAQVHAFIVGVGDYPHLEGGAAHPAVANFGLKQLTTTTLTSVRIANWCIGAHPPVPIGSVELVASATKVTRADGKLVTIDRPVMANIQAAFNAWWKRCNDDPRNIALFYFAGHGLNTASQYLLPSDFGDPNFPDLWENCIDFTSLKVGMGANAARTQVFFVDACREKPIDALLQLNPHGKPLASANAFQIAPSSSAYFAAADGQLAYGPPNDITYFGQALVDALDGAGARNAGGKWVVDTFSLANALGQIMAQLAQVENQPLSCTPQPGGTPVVLHTPAAPLVIATIDCDADMAIDMQRLAQIFNSPAGAQRPWTSKLPPGDWHLRVTRAAATVLDLMETLMPPTYDREVVA